MHGGPICGLLAWAIENRLGRDDLVCSRLTVEILSGVPVEELETSSASSRMESGRRSSNHRLPNTEKFWREQPHNGYLRPKDSIRIVNR